jgi:hypothetical protein
MSYNHLLSKINEIQAEEWARQYRVDNATNIKLLNLIGLFYMSIKELQKKLDIMCLAREERYAGIIVDFLAGSVINYVRLGRQMIDNKMHYRIAILAVEKLINSIENDGINTNDLNHTSRFIEALTAP